MKEKWVKEIGRLVGWYHFKFYIRIGGLPGFIEGQTAHRDKVLCKLMESEADKLFEELKAARAAGSVN